MEPETPNKPDWDKFTPYQGEAPPRDFPAWLHALFVGLYYLVAYGIACSLGAYMFHSVFHLKSRRYSGEYVFGHFHNPFNELLCLGVGAAIGAYLMLHWMMKKPFPLAKEHLTNKTGWQHPRVRKITKMIDALLSVFLGGIGGLLLFYIRIGRRGNKWYPFEDFHSPTTDTISVVIGALCGLWFFYKNQKNATLRDETE